MRHPLLSPTQIDPDIYVQILQHSIHAPLMGDFSAFRNDWQLILEPFQTMVSHEAEWMIIKITASVWHLSISRN